VSGLGAQRTPSGIGRAVGIFYGIQGILNPRAHLVQRDTIMERHAIVDAKERLGTEILAHLQVFVEAESLRGIVAPGVPKWLLQECSGVFSLSGIKV
jgi:hypothetical protein